MNVSTSAELLAVRAESEEKPRQGLGAVQLLSIYQHHDPSHRTSSSSVYEGQEQFLKK